MLSRQTYEIHKYAICMSGKGLERCFSWKSVDQVDAYLEKISQ